MTGNPMAGLVQALAGPQEAAKTPGLRISDGVVVSTNPVRVRQAGADPSTDPLAPLSLVPAEDLPVGARVLLLHRGTQKILLGRTYPL